MALSAEENERLGDMLERLRPEVDNLKNDWQKSFIKDQMERHAKYGAQMYLSAKQWAKIQEIYDEIIGDDDPEDREEVGNDPDDYDDEIPF